MRNVHLHLHAEEDNLTAERWPHTRVWAPPSLSFFLVTKGISPKGCSYLEQQEASILSARDTCRDGG